MIYWPTKTPAAEIDYGADWAPTLSKLADAIVVGSAWTKISGDAVMGVDSITPDGKRTQLRVSAGSNGIDSIFENTVMLDDGEVLTIKAYLKVRA